MGRVLRHMTNLIASVVTTALFFYAGNEIGQRVEPTVLEYGVRYVLPTAATLYTLPVANAIGRAINNSHSRLNIALDRFTYL